MGFVREIVYGVEEMSPNVTQDETSLKQVLKQDDYDKILPITVDTLHFHVDSLQA